MMKRFLAMTAFASILGIVPAVHAQTSFMVSGGLNAPVGRLGDATDIGYIVTGGLNLGGPFIPVGARLEASYSGLGYKGGGGDVRLISGTANAVFNLGATRDAPYLIAGLGAITARPGRVPSATDPAAPWSGSTAARVFASP